MLASFSLTLIYRKSNSLQKKLISRNKAQSVKTTEFLKNFRESNGFTKELIWRNIFGESKFFIFPQFALAQ